MKIKSVGIKNFRGYRDEVEVQVDNLTVFVGRNDIGKSTILEALDIFFNEGKGVVKLDKDDINKDGLAADDKDIVITVKFSELPTSIILDSTNPTTLQSEFLVNSDGYLEVIKKYPNAGAAKVFLKANHPTAANCADLLLKKNAELKKIAQDNGIECESLAVNAFLRSAIWNHFSAGLELDETLIDTSKADAKDIWDKLNKYLPLYTLFQSDRKNSDGDSEVQDPLKQAVKQIIADPELQQKLSDVAQKVEEKLIEVSGLTLAKLQEMNPELAASLKPVIPSSESLKWVDVFRAVSITGDNDIPINKRGSGVKRLILINFFRAEAERRRTEENVSSIVYAIEEPETSQHADHQKMLIKALRDLSGANSTQVLLTTHSSVLVKQLDFDHLRLITEESGTKNIENVIAGQLPYPSLNEVNFVAFKDVTEEYHNELYGYIDAEGWLPDFYDDKPALEYIKILRNGNTRAEQITLTEIIRHQIHHPENTYNTRFTAEQLVESIQLMREFITLKSAG